ncbi:sigma-70 family RNA polymerase sigma factor [bacterium]|nr:sigma-70 family RNA polymerase sigma factor [bacterium]
MSATRPGQLLLRLAPPDPDDGPLLARFAADRDPAAFAAIVRRHGPLVLAVCRRVTGHPQDAEDAFQAVFLVLAKKAGQLRDPGRLGNWLYGVSAKVASRARRSAARRRVREVQAVDPPDPVAPAAPPPTDIGPALHEELAALAAHYREPIVLCDLQGASRAEAARALGIPEGTLSSRLANGRRKLADRLTRRGVVLSALGVPAAVAEGRAVVPEVLVSNTCGVVAAWAAGAAVPAAVARLAAGGFPVKTVLLGGALALSLVAGAVVAGGRADPAPKANPPAPPPPAVVTVVDEPEEGGGAQPKEPAPKVKAVKIGAAPKLREAIDLPVRDGRRVVWSPAGDRLVVVFTPEGRAMYGPPAGAAPPAAPGTGDEALLVVETAGAQAPRVFGATTGHAPDRFVGFTPDGKELLLVRRESGLVSGRHQASFFVIGIVGRPGPDGVPAFPPGAEGGEGGAPIGPAGRALSLVPYSKEFALDPEQSTDFAFAADGKSYRTLVLGRDDAVIRKVELRRVDATAGKALETLDTYDGDFRTAQLSADGKTVVLADAKTDAIAIHPVGKKGWQVVPELDTFPGSEPKLSYPLGLSRDGGRVLVSRGFNKPALLDAATGRTMSLSDAGELLEVHATTASFTADGKLMAVPYSRVEKKESPLKGKGLGGAQSSITRGDPRLGVWDTTTGRLVRSWPGRVTAVAFHPTRPVLAVLEPNGAQTRLGLWDFSAE